MEPVKLVAFLIVCAWLVIAVPLFWANDALGYLAAGERLNAGHQLYSLVPGDRMVEISPPYWSSPSLYPPIWGVLWRPIAALPFGLALWMGVVTVAMMGWLVVTLRDGGKGTAAAVALLGAPFAVLLASGNVAGLLLVGMAWVGKRADRGSGLLVGTMGAVKLMPAVLIVWLLATRRYREAGNAVLTGALLTLASVLLTSPAVMWEYLTVVVPGTKAMGIAPASLLGIPSWTTWVILAVGLVLTWRYRSHRWAVVTVVLGSPAVGVAGLAMLGAAL